MSQEPEEHEPFGDEDPEQSAPISPQLEAALTRTSAPGIFLIVVGVLNVLGGGFVLYRGAFVALNPQQSLIETRQAQEQAKQIPMLAWFSSMGADTTPEAERMGGIINAILGAVELVVAGIIVMAGARMRVLRGYGLAMTGAILALLPCISPSACCALGIVAGVWALIVLANPEVRSTFE